MSDRTQIGRKDFIKLTLTLSGAYLMGCGSDAPSNTGSGGDSTGGRASGGAAGRAGAGAGDAGAPEAGAPEAGAGGEPEIGGSSGSAGAPAGGASGASGASGSGGTSGAGGTAGRGGSGGATGGTGGTAGRGGGGAGGSSAGAGGSGGAGPVCTAGSTVMTSIGTNHGHTLIIPITDVIDGLTKTYVAGLTSGGPGPHTHSITITADDFAALKATGRSPSITSAGPVGTGGNHMHACVLSC